MATWTQTQPVLVASRHLSVYEYMTCLFPSDNTSRKKGTDDEWMEENTPTLFLSFCLGFRLAQGTSSLTLTVGFVLCVSRPLLLVLHHQLPISFFFAASTLCGGFEFVELRLACVARVTFSSSPTKQADETTVNYTLRPRIAR